MSKIPLAGIVNQELVRKVKSLEGMDLAALKAEYAALYGVDPVTKNVTALRSQIARKLNRMGIDARKKAGKETVENPAPVTPAPEKASKPKPAPESDTAVLKRIADLSGRSVGHLREEYERLYGRNCASRNKRFLLKKIAEAVRREVGAISQPTLTVPLKKKEPKGNAGSRAKMIARDQKAEAKPERSTPAVRDSRLPKPGTVIERVYKNRTLQVTVTESGFEYQGKPFRSLSALAKHITGSIVNGFVWFGLGLPETRRKKSK